jgi:hypothetical protein
VIQFTTHFHAHSTKNPEAKGLGVGMQLVQTLERPYGLPMASVSKESVSREVRFIRIELAGKCGTVSTTP